MVEEPLTPRAELLIAAAGPAMSVVLAGLAFGGRALAGGPAWTLVLFGYLGAVNFVIAVFNLLPGYPLDGGRILRAALWAWRGSFGWATRVASTIGRISGLMLAGFGTANAVVAGEFIGGLWLVMVGIFVYQSARDAGRLAEIRERLAPLEIEQIMGAPSAAAGAGDARSLGPHDSAWLAFRTLAGTGTPVVRVVEDGRVVGAVDRQRLKESLARRDGDEHAA